MDYGRIEQLWFKGIGTDNMWHERTQVQLTLNQTVCRHYTEGTQIMWVVKEGK